MEEYDLKEINYAMEPDDPKISKLLLEAFTWSKTPEGDDYWSEVYLKIEAMELQSAKETNQ